MESTGLQDQILLATCCLVYVGQLGIRTSSYKLHGCIQLANVTES